MAEVKVIEVQIKSNLDETNNDVSKLKTNLKTATNEAKDFDKAIGSKKGASFTELKDSIGGLVPGFDKASTGANSFNKQLLLLVANPIGAVVAAVVLAVVGLVAIFKTFQPVVDKVEQSVAALGSVLNVIKNTFIAVFTGTKSLGQAFSGLGSDMSSAAKRTMELVKAQQDLEDVLAQQEVQTSRTRAEINKLNVQAKNRALSEEERLKLLQRASTLENQDFLQRRKNSDEQVRQAREAIAIKAGFSKAEIKQLKEQGLAAKELAESKGGNFDEEFKVLANAQKNRIGLEDESTANLEKNQNKQDALFDAQQAKREKANEESLAKSKEASDKRIALDKEEKKKLDDAEKERQELIGRQGAKARDEYEAAEKLIADARKANEDALKTENQIKVEKEIADFELKKANLLSKNLSIEEIEAEHKRKLTQLDNEFFAKEADNNIKATADAKAAADAQNAIEQAKFDLKLSLLNQTASAIGGLGALFKKGTAAAKAAALAEIAIGSAVGLINGLDIAQKSAKGTGPAAAFAFPIFFATQVAAVFGAVNRAKGILSGGGGSAPSTRSGGSSTSSPSIATAAPNFNVVGASSTNQLAQTIGQQQNQPIKAYVVANDVTTQQGLDRNIVKSATIG